MEGPAKAVLQVAKVERRKASVEIQGATEQHQGDFQETRRLPAGLMAGPRKGSLQEETQHQAAGQVAWAELLEACLEEAGNLAESPLALAQPKVASLEGEAEHPAASLVARAGLQEASQEETAKHQAASLAARGGLQEADQEAVVEHQVAILLASVAYQHRSLTLKSWSPPHLNRLY